jgi:TP901 family phage tail tape measure protein
MSPIGRLFFEISGDSSKLNASLREAIATAKDAGVQITRAGQSFVSKFDEALNPTKKLTEQIQLLEAAGKKQADIMKVMGGQIETATKAAREMGQPVDDLIKKYTSLESRMKQAGESMMSFGRNMSMYVTGPIVAIGAAAIKAGDDYDKAVAKIRTGTGAIGDQLKSLTKDMTEVWGTVPSGAEEIGQAIADLNTRLGLTGKPLQEMATQMLNLARMANTDVAPVIAAATRLFGDWSVATADQSKSLDYLFRASQATGIGVQSLMEITVQFGAPMRALGFSLEQTAALMGKWEKEGVNMETVLSGLRQALGKFAEKGMDPVESLQAIQDAIKNARTESEATAIAFQVFGKRAAIDMGRAIIEGRMNIADLVKTLREGKDTINAADEASKTFGERMQELQQKTEKALVPIGEKLLDAFEELQPTIIAGIDALASAAKAFADLDPWMQKLIIGAVGVVAAIGPMSYGIGAAVKAASSMVGLLSGGGGLVSLLGSLGKGAAVAGAAFAGWEIGRWISQLFDLDEKLGRVWTKLGLFQGGLKESNDALAKTNLLQYTKLAKEYGDELQKLHLNIQKGNKTEQEWSDALTQAFVEVGKLHPAVQAAATGVKNLGASGSDAASGLGLLDDSLKKLRESLEKNSRPADELAAEMKKLKDSGAPIDQILAAYAERLVEAAEKQIRLHQKMKPATEALVEQAGAFNLVIEAEKAAQESAQFLPDMLKGIFDEIDKAAKQAKEDLEKVKDITDSVSKETAKSKTEELELQRAILDATIPQTEEQKRMLEAEKDRLDYEIKSEVIWNKYAAMRLDIYKKIENMDPFGEAYHKALEALNSLDAAEKAALENLANKQGVEVIKRHQEEYQKMVDGVREGAGEIFDAIVSRGEGAFTKLKDWIEGTFLTSLKKIFQNFITSLMTDGQFSLQKLLAGAIPGGIGGGSGQPQIPVGDWGNVLGGGSAAGSYDLGSIISGGQVVIPEMPATKPNYWASIFGQKGTGMNWTEFLGGGEGGFWGNNGQGGFLGTGTGGIGGRGVGGAAGAAMMAGGASMMISGWQGSGIGSWAQSIGGGALTGLAIGGPIGALIGGGVGAIGKIIGAISGPNSYEAGSKEVARDFGGIKYSDKEVQAMYNQMGFSEERAWSYRAFLNRSPVMIQQLAAAAEQQGKMDEFLKQLEPGGKGSWGMDMRTPVEIGMITGDWSELNDVFKELAQNDKHFKNFVNEMGPGWEKQVLIADQAATKLLDTFTNMRAAIKSSITDPLDESIDTFMNAGKVTDELREKIVRFGGDLAAFEKVANLSQLNGYFQELAQHFRQTGEMLPDLVRIAGEYGANVEAMTDAVDKLETLRKTSATVGSLQSSLQGMAQEFDPIRQLLSGQWNSSIETALSGAGLDPNRFSTLSTAIRARGNWDNITNQALSGGIINKDLQDALAKFGGEEGQLALQMYRQGFNTLTQDLLDKTKEAMDRSYQQSIQDALDYLGNVGDETNEQITQLTSTVEDQLQIASDNLEEAVNTAREAVVGALDKILIAIYEQGENAGGMAEAGSEVPSLASGGEVLKTGLAIVHEGEHFDGGKGFGPQVALQNCTIYGYDDFVEKVRQAGIDLERRAFA